MLALTMTVSHQDGRTVPISVKPVDQVAFERHFKCSFADAFSGRPAFEHIYFVAWHAARSGLEFDPWLETIEGIDFGVAEPVDPTPPAVSAGP